MVVLVAASVLTPATPAAAAPSVGCKATNLRTLDAYTLLQDAVDDALTGDILSVSGVCRESLVIGRSLTIRGGSKSNAVIDASSLTDRRVITMVNNVDVPGAEENPNVVLTNVTLTGGNGNGPGDGGGGAVRMSSGMLTLTGMTRLTGNIADSGGGVYCNRGNVVMTDNAMIDHNTAVYSGGGLLIRDCHVTMSGKSQVAANRVTETYGDGGGVSTGYPVLMGGQARITGNSAGAQGKGGGIHLTGGPVSLSGSASIDRNTAFEGGGIYEYFSRTSQSEGVTVSQKSTISSNTATGNGGGLFRNLCTSGSAGAAPGGIIKNNPNNVYDSEHPCFY